MAFWSRAEKLIANLMQRRTVEDIQAALHTYGCVKHSLDDISDFVAEVIAGTPDSAMPEGLRSTILNSEEDSNGTEFTIEVSGPPTEPMIDF